MILVTVAVKADRRNFLGLCPLGQGNSNRLGCTDVAAGLDLASQLLVPRTGGTKGDTGRIVDDLGIDIAETAKYRKARPLAGSADALLQPLLAPISSGGFDFDCLHVFIL